MRVHSLEELDRLVAEKVFGKGSSPRRYSTSLVRAFQLILHVINLGWHFQIAFLPYTHEQWTCKFLHFENRRACIGLSAKPGVAVCLAALKVMGVEALLHLN